MAAHPSTPWRSNAGASAHARYRAEWLAGRRQRLVVCVVLALALGVPATATVGWQAGLVLAVLGVAAHSVWSWRTHDAVRTWRRGAKGERRTARQLRRLESLGYVVLHDRALPRGRANVDHLVIGPTGVFVIDSKQWSKGRRVTRGRRYVQVGKRWGEHEVRGVLYETRAVAEALSRVAGTRVEVQALVSVHGPYVPYRGLNVNGARLLRAATVPSWILRAGGRLDSATLARLQAAAVATFPAYVEQPRSA